MCAGGMAGVPPDRLKLSELRLLCLDAVDRPGIEPLAVLTDLDLSCLDKANHRVVAPPPPSLVAVTVNRPDGTETVHPAEVGLLVDLDRRTGPNDHRCFIGYVD